MNVRAETSKVIVQVPPTALIRLLIMEKLLYYAAVGGFARPSSWAKAQQVRSVRNTSRVLRRVHEQRGEKTEGVGVTWCVSLDHPLSGRIDPSNLIKMFVLNSGNGTDQQPCQIISHSPPAESEMAKRERYKKKNMLPPSTYPPPTQTPCVHQHLHTSFLPPGAL